MDPKKDRADREALRKGDARVVRDRPVDFEDVELGSDYLPSTRICVNELLKASGVERSRGGLIKDVQSVAEKAELEVTSIPETVKGLIAYYDLEHRLKVLHLRETTNSPLHRREASLRDVKAKVREGRVSVRRTRTTLEGLLPLRRQVTWTFGEEKMDECDDCDLLDSPLTLPIKLPSDGLSDDDRSSVDARDWDVNQHKQMDRIIAAATLRYAEALSECHKLHHESSSGSLLCAQCMTNLRTQPFFVPSLSPTSSSPQTVVVPEVSPPAMTSVSSRGVVLGISLLLNLIGVVLTAAVYYYYLQTRSITSCWIQDDYSPPRLVH